MNDNVVTKSPRIEHQLDQLIWRLARIEGDMQDLRRALNAFRATLALMQAQQIPPDDGA